MKKLPRYYDEAKATLRDALLPSFGAGEAIGRLMVAAARGQRSARELLALRKKWTETLEETPDHQVVNALDYKGISELAENPILSDRDLEALGLLLQKISQAQAENGLSWEINRKLTGEWLEKLALKVKVLSGLASDPARTKETLRTLAQEMEKIGKILSKTIPWEDPAREKVWETRQKAEETIDEAIKEDSDKEAPSDEEAEG